MFAKVKSPVFIDRLKFELDSKSESRFKALLRDENGSVCGTMEANIPEDRREVTWNGLDTLPYGVYTLELSQGEDELKMRMVKRV